MKNRVTDRITSGGQSEKDAQEVLENMTQSLREGLEVQLPVIVNVSGISTQLYRLSGLDSSPVRKGFRSPVDLVEVTRKIVKERLGINPWKTWAISCLKYSRMAY